MAGVACVVFEILYCRPEVVNFSFTSVAVRQIKLFYGLSRLAKKTLGRNKLCGIL